MSDDADRLGRLRKLLKQQEQLVEGPSMSKQGAPDAAIAVLEALRAEIASILERQQARVRALGAQVASGQINPETFNNELGKLYGARPGASPKELLEAMLKWIERASGEDHAQSELVFAAALATIRKTDDGGGPKP